MCWKGKTELKRYKYMYEKITRIEFMMLSRLKYKEKLSNLSPPHLQGEKGGSGAEAWGLMAPHYYYSG